MVASQRVKGAAEALASAQIRDADGDTRVALLQLARQFDEHMAVCPHVDPPVARPYLPKSHDEQAVLDRYMCRRCRVVEAQFPSSICGSCAADVIGDDEAISEYGRLDEIANDRRGTHSR